SLIEDDCVLRRMILHDSTWLPDGEKAAIPERRIVATGGANASKLPPAALSAGASPAFRGPGASGVAGKQNNPHARNPETGYDPPLANADSGARALEPDRLGGPGVRHERDQQPRERDVQAGTVWRRRCLRRYVQPEMGALRDRHEHRQDPVGAGRVRGTAR